MSTPDLLGTLLGYALKQTQHALHRRMERVVNPFGLTFAQYVAMAALRQTPDQTNADLAEAAFLTPQSMQGVLANLEAAGLVERRPDQHHGRRQLARLTESGQALAAKVDGSVWRIEAALRDAVPPASLDDTLALLERLRLAMQAPAED